MELIFREAQTSWWQLRVANRNEGSIAEAVVMLNLSAKGCARQEM
jgi:hypothetical protein